MSWINVYIHLVWSTKERRPFLTDDIRDDVFRHLRKNAREKDIHLDFINGYTDHVHCLISLKADQTIEKVVQLLKGESSHWINKQLLLPVRFGWQEEYFAASVSESHVESVRRYIENQEEHHRTRSFDDEFEDFLIRSGFKKSGG